MIRAGLRARVCGRGGLNGFIGARARVREGVYRVGLLSLLAVAAQTDRQCD